MFFSYDTYFLATVTPVTTMIKGINRSPYVDPDAGGNGLSGRMSLTLQGSYDTDDIRQVAGGQVVISHLNNVYSDVFGTVLCFVGISITKYSNGNIALTLLNPSFLLNNQRTKVFDETIITAKSAGLRATANQPATPTSSLLTNNGTFNLYGQRIANLYGVQAGDHSFHTYENATDYLDGGANVAKGMTPSNSFDGGTFTLFGGEMPPGSAVPEPATWAMIMGGLGGIGGMLRQRRKANVKVSFT